MKKNFPDKQQCLGLKYCSQRPNEVAYATLHRGSSAIVARNRHTVDTYNLKEMESQIENFPITAELNFYREIIKRFPGALQYGDVLEFIRGKMLHTCIDHKKFGNRDVLFHKRRAFVEIKRMFLRKITE